MSRIVNQARHLYFRAWRRFWKTFGTPPGMEARPVSELASEPWVEIVKAPDRPTTRITLPIPFDVDGRSDAFFETRREFPCFPRCVARLRGVRVHSGDGFLFLPDGKVLLENHFFFDDHVQNHWAYFSRKSRPRHITGPAFSLTGFCPSGHYHVMTEVLYRLQGCLELLPRKTSFIVPRQMTATHRSAFEALGIPVSQMVAMNFDEVMEFDDLWYAPPVTKSGFDTPEAVQWLRGEFSRLEGKSPRSLGLTSRPTKVYISRRSAKRRRILNEDEVIPLLERHGYLAVECEKLSFAEQAFVFSEATEVVAPHGAGLVNLLFTRKPGRLLELFPKTFPRGGTCYWSLAHALGWDYTFSRREAATESADVDDMVVSVDAVERWLNRASTPKEAARCP